MPARPQFACNRCTARKVKCDRQIPCLACSRHKADCVYEPAREPFAKRRKLKVTHEDEKIAQRLERYERLLRQHRIEFGQPRSSSEPRSIGHNDAGYNNSVRNSREPAVMNRHIGMQGGSPVAHQTGQNVLYESIAAEMRDSNVGVNQVTDNVNGDDTAGNSYLLGSKAGGRLAAEPRFPTAGNSLSLWRTFKERVDPVTKIIHTPTLERVICKAASDPYSLPRNLRTLVLAIYSAAIMSLSDGDCQMLFEESRTRLLQGYVASTKAALLGVDFMSTSSNTVLQALILHILSIQDTYPTQAVWCVNGIAVRIAQSMRLDRDGESLGLSPYDTELRRRMWWTIKGNDFQLAELCGLAKFKDINHGSNRTKFPSNFGDAQLHEHLTTLPQVTNRVTDGIFVALRAELNKFASRETQRAQQHGRSDPQQWNLDEVDTATMEKTKILEMLRDTLEENYIRPCDPSQPLELLTMLVARTSLDYVKFMLHHPRQWKRMNTVTDQERRSVWDIAMRLLRQHLMAITNPLLKSFAWHAKQFIPWHALIHVLNTLCIDPSHVEAEEAWQLVEQIFTLHPAITQDNKRPIYVAIRLLCTKAFNHKQIRRPAISCPTEPAGTDAPPNNNIPEFVTRLRYQHIRERRPPVGANEPLEELVLGGQQVLNQGGRDHSHGTNLKTRAVPLEQEVDTWEPTKFQPSSGFTPLDEVVQAEMVDGVGFDFDFQSLFAGDDPIHNSMGIINWDSFGALLGEF